MVPDSVTSEDYMMTTSLDITFLIQIVIVPTLQSTPFEGKIPIGKISIFSVGIADQ